MSKHITNVKKVSGTAESKAKQVLKEKELLDENQLAVQDVEKAKELSLIETSTEEQLVAQNTDNYSDVSYAGGEAMLVTDANVTGADALVASEVGATEGAVASSSAGTLAYAAVGALGAAGLVGLMLNNSSSGGVNNNNARDNQINHNDTQPTPQVQATQQNSNTSQNIPKQDDAPNDNNNTPIVLPELKVSYDENTQTITLYNLKKGEFKYKLLATDDWLISNTSDFTDVTENPDGTVTVKYNIPQDIQGSGDPDPVEFNIITKQGERESNTVNYTYDKVTIVELDEPQIIQNDDTTCTIKVTGLSEPGATVVITIDGEKPQEKTITLGDEQYEFEVEFTVEQTVLYQNLNINATATDTANNTATLEQAVEVTINPSNKLLTLSLVEDTGISSKPETLTDKVTSKTDIKVDGIDDFNATSYVWSSDNGATWNNGNSSVFKGTETSGNVNILAALSQDGNSPDDNAGDPISFSYTYDNVVEGITNPKYDFANEFKDYINNPTGEIVLGFSGSSSREKTIVDYTFSQKGQEDQTESFINDNLGNDYACYFKVINNGESFKLTIKETDYVGNTQTQSSIQGTTPLDIEYIDSLSA